MKHFVALYEAGGTRVATLGTTYDARTVTATAHRIEAEATAVAEDPDASPAARAQARGRAEAARAVIDAMIPDMMGTGTGSGSEGAVDA